MAEIYLSQKWQQMMYTTKDSYFLHVFNIQFYHQIKLISAYTRRQQENKEAMMSALYSMNSSTIICH